MISKKVKKTINTKSTISIMADFGMGPYAWLRSPEYYPPSVGLNIADSVSGFPEEFGISQELQSQLADWVIEFERNSDDSAFDWKRWNQTGISLSQKMKQEVGDKFRVEYHYPFEDPTNGGLGKIEVIE